MARPAMPLRRRLNVLAVVTVIVVIVLAVLVGTAVAALHSALSTATTVIDPASRAVSALNAALVDQETAERGYFITGKSVFLGPYQTGQSNERSATAQLSRLLHDRPRLQRELAAISTATATWRHQAAEPEIAAAKRHDAFDKSQLANVEFGRKLFDRVRAATGRLQTDLRSLQAEGNTRLQHAQQRLEAALGISVGVSVLVLVLSRVFFRRWIEGPIQALSSAVRRARIGGPVVAVASDSPPELVALGADVERMRSSLAHEVEEVARANEALRQQGPAVLALRDELRPTIRTVPTLRVASRLQPAEGVLAGDWYDVRDLGRGRWAAALVDVSGHGAPAGILALTLKSLFGPALREHADLGAALSWIAANLDGWDESFATAVVVAGDESSDVVRYAAAGHPPAVLCRGDAVQLLEPTGPLLAPLTAHLGWSQREFMLPPGARLVLYTDGVVEARGDGKAQYGVQRLTRLLTAPDVAALDPSVVIEQVLRDVAAFSPTHARDDRTLVVLERCPRGADGVPPQLLGSRHPSASEPAY